MGCGISKIVVKENRLLKDNKDHKKKNAENQFSVQDNLNYISKGTYCFTFHLNSYF